MQYLPFLKALLARGLFAIHGIITIWRVTSVNSEPIFYLLIIPVCLLPVEMILTLKFTEKGEWKWFCPSVMLYLASVVPGLWLLQFDLYDKRTAYRDLMKWEDCSVDTGLNTSSLNSEIAGIRVNILVPLSDQTWAVALEQLLLAFLIIGRWLLPKGAITRDQLSQLLLVYIGMGADILEFSLESLNEDVVICNLILIVLIVVLWTWSLLQFSLVLTSVSARRDRPAKVSGGRYCKECCSCCQNEIWALSTTVVMQDGPFLIMRLFLLIEYKIVNQMMLFFTVKNVMVILLQVYRMIIVWRAETPSPNEDENSLEAVEGGMSKEQSSSQKVLTEAGKFRK